MYVICYKIGDQSPIVVRDARFVSVYASSVKYCDRAKELNLIQKYPDAVSCEDKLLTVTVMQEDGSMATVYDVVSFEGE